MDSNPAPCPHDCPHTDERDCAYVCLSESYRIISRIVPGDVKAAQAEPMHRHIHGDNCRTVMAIRNTFVDEGVAILDRYVQAATQAALVEFAEELKGVSHYLGMNETRLIVTHSDIDAELWRTK